MIDTDARATAARLEFERTVSRVERTDPATSGRVRLVALSLGRELKAKRVTSEAYAAELESLTAALRDVLELTTPPAGPAQGAAPAPTA
ncbi:MAG: hypothetical protein VX747_09395 [Actinomycetota bacterium]|nr:hypothetical protein [Actinomycetota bacterium]